MRAFSVRCAAPQVAGTRAALATTPCSLRAAVARPCARPRCARLVTVKSNEEDGLFVDLSPGFAFYKARSPRPKGRAASASTG